MQRAPEHYAPRAPSFHSFHLDQEIPEDVKTAAEESDEQKFNRMVALHRETDRYVLPAAAAGAVGGGLLGHYLGKKVGLPVAGAAIGAVPGYLVSGFAANKIPRVRGLRERAWRLHQEIPEDVKTAGIKLAGTDDAALDAEGFYKGQPASPHTVKFKTEFQGIPINVDRPKGFIMKGKDVKGNEWARRYKYDYGFIPKTLGGDKDGLDVFIGPDKKHEYAYWAVQRKEDGSFDEYKCFLGFPDREAATSAYRQHIPKKYFKGMMTMKVEMMHAMLGKVNPNEQIKRASVPGFFDELQWLVKNSAQEEKPIDKGELALRGAGTVGLAAVARPFGEAGAERLLGAQRIYHGTSKGGAESILRAGLDPAFGGGATGGSAAIQSPHFLEESKGRIHVATGPTGRRVVAVPHAGLAGAHEEAMKAGRTLSRAEAERSYLRSLGSGFKGRGEIVGGSIPYEDFVRYFEQDPDQIPGLAFRSTEKVGPENLVKGRVGIRSIVKGRSRDLGRYIAKHPGRFATGAALMAVPAAAAYGGYKLMRPVIGGKEKTSTITDSRFDDLVYVPRSLDQQEVAKGLRQFGRSNIRARLLRALHKAEEE